MAIPLKKPMTRKVRLPPELTAAKLLLSEKFPTTHRKLNDLPDNQPLCQINILCVGTMPAMYMKVLSYSCFILSHLYIPFLSFYLLVLFIFLS